MATIYEHNFGFWEIDGQVEQAFFEHVQRQSVQTTPATTLRAPRTPHAAQNDLRLLRHRARIRRTHDDRTRPGE